MMGKRPVSMRGLCRSPLIHLLLIGIAGSVVYAATLDAPFVFDDRTSIVDNLLIRNLNDFLASGYSFYPRRFLGYLSFAINYRIGGLDVAGYHAVNLSIHLSASFLVYWLSLLTFNTPGGGRSRLAPNASLIALFAGLLFVLHPVQTQAVTYVTQRLASLAALIYLLAMVMWVLALQGSEREGEWRFGRLYAAGAALAALAAMITKETAAALPLAAFLYGRLFFPASLSIMLRRLLPLLAGVIIPIVAWLVAVAPGNSFHDLLAHARGGAEVSRWDYLVTQPAVLVKYLRLIFFPVAQNLDHDFPIYHSLLAPQVFGAILVLGALIMLGMRLVRLTSSGADPGLRVIALGIGWFFVTLLVESTVIPIDDVMVEHRLYLPLAGISLGVAAAVGYLTAVAGSGRVLAGSLLLFLALGTATWRRNELWESPVRLWRDSVEKSPGKARPHYNLGTSLNDSGAPGAARSHLGMAVTLQPDFADAWQNLAVAHASLGAFPEAIAAYRKALQLDPDLWRAHNGLGVALMSLGRVDEAVASYREAVRLAPGYAQARNNLGAAYGMKGKGNEAVVQLEEAVRLDPENPLFRQNLEKARGMPGEENRRNGSAAADSREKR